MTLLNDQIILIDQTAEEIATPVDGGKTVSASADAVSVYRQPVAKIAVGLMFVMFAMIIKFLIIDCGVYGDLIACFYTYKYL